MVIPPKNLITETPFVDREGHTQTFREAVSNIGQKRFSVLVYYGIPGIGKTSLRKELPKCLEKSDFKYRYSKVIWASIDLRLDKHREKNTFLVTLKNDLQKKYNINFPAFEIAHAIYWKKANPEVPLRKENYLLFEGDEAFDDFFGIVDQIPYFSLVPNVARLLKNFPDYLRKWWAKKGEAELKKLSEKEPLEIEEMLPYFWAQDLDNYLENTSKSAVLFIDTYEALWENHRSDGHSRDYWIREELITCLPEKVLWVICGREILQWGEIKSEWNEYLTQYEVEELLRKYCIKYLETRGITDKEIQESIFKVSKGIPYYLELSVHIYERIMESRKPEPEDFGENYQEITDKLFRFLSPEEKNALNVLSIPRFWDYNLFGYLVKEFSTGYPTNNYEDLCNFSFIGKTETGKQQMHQLMQDCLRKSQEKKRPDSVKRIHEAIIKYYTNKLENIDIRAITPEYELALTEAFYHSKEVLKAEDLFNWFISASDPFDRAAFWQLITPLYEEMLGILEAKLGPQHPSVATTLANLAGLYRRMGNNEKALPLYQRALEIHEKILGSEHPDVATTINNLAITYENMGDYKKAFPLYQRALEIREKVLGPEHQDVANSLNNLAILSEKTGGYERALPLYQRALYIQEKVLDPNHPNVATTLSYFGLLYSSMGNYEKALSLYQRALDIQEKVLSPNHPDVATTINNLAGLYRRIGDNGKALPLYQRALKIREHALDPNHPDVAETLNNLAGLYKDVGDYGRSLLFYQRTLETLEKVLGPEHPDVAITLSNLAGLSEKTGDYEKALPLYQRSLEIYEKTLDLQHPYVATTLNSLGVLYCQMGDYERAFPLYQRALGIREKVLGPEHPDVATTLDNLARLYYHVGDYENALPLYRKALRIQEKVLGPNHCDVARIQHNLAGLYEKMGDYEKALPLYQRALEIREKALGLKHRDVAITLNNLAGLYYHMEDYEKALPLYQRALEIYNEVLDPQHPSVAITLNNLAKLYYHMGDYEKALPLYQRALEICKQVLGPEHPNTIAIRNNFIQFTQDMKRKEGD